VAGTCATNTLTQSNTKKSFKRGLPAKFCNTGLHGQRDLDLMKAGVTWTYNWGAGPEHCATQDPSNSVASSTTINDYSDAQNGVEYVPMLWGFAYGANHQSSINRGGGTVDCSPDSTGVHPKGKCLRVDNDLGAGYCTSAASGPACTGAAGENLAGTVCYDCYHEIVDWNTFKSRVPHGAQYLLCGNEPSLMDQASMSPTEYATMWKYCEQMALELDVQLVAPATEDCGTGSGNDCSVQPAYAANPLQRLEWTRLFYDACRAGSNGRTGSGGYSAPNVGDCRIDYNAIHSYGANYRGGYVLGSINTWKTTVLNSAELAYGNKPFWITEFGGNHNCNAGNDASYLGNDLDDFETSSVVFRYSHFQAHVGADGCNLQTNSLLGGLIDDTTKTTCTSSVWGRTLSGDCYLAHGIGVANASTINQCTQSGVNAGSCTNWEANDWFSKATPLGGVFGADWFTP
jgi:hypothetical protein